MNTVLRRPLATLTVPQQLKENWLKATISPTILTMVPSIMNILKYFHGDQTDTGSWVWENRFLKANLTMLSPDFVPITSQYSRFLAAPPTQSSSPAPN